MENVTQEQAMVKVALVENTTIVRSGIRSLLEKNTNVQVVEETDNGNEMLKLIEKGCEADVIMAEMNLPGMGGLELVRQLNEQHPGKKVIILSMLDNENYVMQAFNAGASGYLLKNISNEELMFALQHVAAGGKYICNELSLKILNKLTTAVTAPVHPPLHTHLSKRETEVLLLIAEGLTNNEIAAKLFTSRRTVEGHRKNLIDKTGARNTAALIRFAVQNGLLK